MVVCGGGVDVNVVLSFQSGVKGRCLASWCWDCSLEPMQGAMQVGTWVGRCMGCRLEGNLARI